MVRGISVRGLNKAFPGFRLKDVNIEVPRGYVTAIIGNNGSGKTSLLKCITGSYVPDGGMIEFGIPLQNGRIGVIFDECPYPPIMKVQSLSVTMSKIFPDWDDRRFANLCKDYGINMVSKVGTLSRGQRMKLQMAVAFSHETDYLIMDEPMSGLDPDFKDRFMSILRDYISDEDRTVVMASHQMSELEKIADQIVLLLDGKVVICDDRTTIMDQYGIVRQSSLDDIDPSYIVGLAETDLGITALVRNRSALSEEMPDMPIEDASLEDIVVYHMRGKG